MSKNKENITHKRGQPLLRYETQIAKKDQQKKHLLRMVSKSYWSAQTCLKAPTAPLFLIWIKTNNVWFASASVKIKEESKVANGDWVYHQACSQAKCIYFITNLIMRNHFNKLHLIEGRSTKSQNIKQFSSEDQLLEKVF